MLKRKVALACLLLAAPWAQADWGGTDEEFLALQLALAKVCPAVYPAQEAAMAKGGALAVCELTRRNAAARAWSDKLMAAPTFGPRLKAMERDLWSPLQTGAIGQCQALLTVPERHCEWVDGPEPQARPKAVPTTVGQP
ncbi:MAG: hypothetical protein RJA98_2773 [Pseudomonadota bacterium]|jgi:hypothetical protein